ncbi:MAG: B12-binding domain-containing radical SAM protein [bacterium]|nr:B12-binding domain-containing radical SAM protein [bacterium]MCP5067751.1 B12-binding domain-containing radical SAM protein [bacterium]
MRLLFVNPNLRPGHPTRYLPVGLAYVMTAARGAGYDVELLDIGLHDQSDDETSEFLAQDRWDAILTGSIVTHYKWMKTFTRMARQNAPRATQIVGNSVAGSVPDLFLRHSEADVVVVGEGELTTVAVLDALRTGNPLHEVDGIVIRGADGELIHTPRRKAAPVDSFPMPDWDLFEVDRYFAQTDAPSAWGIDKDPTTWRTMPVATARGCVFKCSFCHIVYKHDPYRHRCAGGILQEVRRNIERYSANYVNFWDDLTFYKLSQAEKMVDAILDSRLQFAWSASVRTDLFGNPEIPFERRLEVALKFREAGCRTLGYSLESGNARILEMMNKRVRVEYFEEQIRVLREAGITSNTSVVLGYPIETCETIRETFDLCERNGIYPSVGFLLPLPDTVMYEYALSKELIRDENAYLDSITERQDICLNMTELEDQLILDEIQTGCARLNEKLDLGLSEDQFIRTGGYKQHTPKSDETRTRNLGDTSFSYSKQAFNH